MADASETGAFMTELFPIELDDEIAELERELRLRRRVYPGYIAARHLTQAKGDRQCAVLESAIESLRRLKGLEK